ncbi:thioredoxin family protein [Rhodobacter xanthinilyticus]|nr:thioredoxin family protein [Rhodobacter xanthinilyticus]
MDIKVLGTGCAKCRATVDLIEKIAAETGAEIALEKVEEMRAIVGYGVMSTPAVVIDGKVVHKGSVPAAEMVRGWLA